MNQPTTPKKATSSPLAVIKPFIWIGAKLPIIKEIINTTIITTIIVTGSTVFLNYLEHKRTMLEKKIATLERFTAIVNKDQLILNLERHRNKLLKTSECNADYSFCENLTDDQSHKVNEITKEQIILNSEFASAVSLAKIYFEPEAQRAVQELKETKLWWKEENKQKIQTALDAMGKEVKSGK